ncbi:MAG: hypothetical protein PHU14_09905 [Methylovulum sp.]|nr:hypothetical protein [Methylovulum sp.]
MDNVRIGINDAEIAAALQVFGERRVVNALRSAVKTTTTWAEKQLDSRMAADTGIPIQAFKQYRVHKKLLGGYNDGTIEAGSIWDGYNDIAAQFAGKVSQADTGAWAGKYFFEGAFVAHMKNGMEGVFKREGDQLISQSVTLVNAETIADQVAAEASAELLRRFKAKFQV